MTYSIKKGKPEDFAVEPTSSYPFDKLKPGYYFEVPFDTKVESSSKKFQAKITYAVEKFKKRNPEVKLAVRKDKKTLNVRVFCLED